MAEDHRVVGAVEVLLRAVPEVGAHDRDPAARPHRVPQLRQHGANRVLVRQVLEEVRHENAVEVLTRQLDVHDVADDHFHVGRFDVALPDEVDAPPVAGGHRRDELAAAGRRIEDAARLAKSLVDVPGNLGPDRLPAGLVDIAEPVGVQPLVVDAARCGCRGLGTAGCHVRTI
jgi:hypothetical protein